MVCRAFKKRTTGNSKTSIEGLDSSSAYYYDEASGVSSALDYITRMQPQPPKFVSSQNLMCKQELESISTQFVQLPQLESPSLPPMRRLSPMSAAAQSNINIIEDDGYNIIGESKSKKVIDWRDLDKFVASQLSHGDDQYEFESRCDSDMGLLLLQSGREEAGSKLNELSTSDSDIGICIFNK